MNFLVSCVWEADKYLFSHYFVLPVTSVRDTTTVCSVTLLSAIVFHGILPLKYYFSVLCSVLHSSLYVLRFESVIHEFDP